MRKLAAAVMVLALLVPGAAFAGSSTDAALGLGAFAVFNQIISGTGIFGGYRPAAQPIVVAPPVQERVVVRALGGFGGPFEAPAICNLEERHGYAGARPSIGGIWGALRGPGDMQSRGAPRLRQGASEHWGDLGGPSRPRRYAISRSATA